MKYRRENTLGCHTRVLNLVLPKLATICSALFCEKFTDVVVYEKLKRRIIATPPNYQSDAARKL